MGTAIESISRRAKLEKGYPLGPGGKRITRKPPRTTSSLFGKKTREARPRGDMTKKAAAAMRKYDAEVIQEKLRIEKELGV